MPPPRWAPIHWRTITSVIYPAARSGIVTGLLLAVARISGETAPLLFTALNNQFWSSNLNAPMANLPVVIFQFALSPVQNWQQLAWSGALLITLSILVLSITARLVVSSLPGGRALMSAPQRAAAGAEPPRPAPPARSSSRCGIWISTTAARMR